MVFLVRGRDAENIEKKTKQREKKKHWKKKKNPKNTGKVK